MRFMNKPLHEFLLYLEYEKLYSPRTVESYRIDATLFHDFMHSLSEQNMFPSILSSSSMRLKQAFVIQKS